MATLLEFFSIENFMPHGHCYLWQPGILWLHVVSDAFITLAYTAIPITLLYFIGKRKDIPFHWIFVAFGIFIFSCGATHVMEIVTVWTPVYGLSGLVKLGTAGASIATAMLLIKLMPQALALPSPAQLRLLNRELQQEIAERKQVEKELMAANAEREALHQAMLKTAEQAARAEESRKGEARLLRVVEELKRSNEELDTFAYVASHDLKSPLRGISQLAQWILEDLPSAGNDAVGKHVRLLRSRIDRMEQLLDDLLTYSRIGRLEDHLNPVNVRELARETLALQGGHGFRLILAGDLPDFYTLATPFEQVLRNLISNAIKHHHRKEEGEITVAAKSNGAFFDFSISDNGPGIPPQFHERVFEMFQTLRPRDRVEGSGMGLALVRKIVKTYGGTVTLSSDGTHGTTIHFTWPNEAAMRTILEQRTAHVAASATSEILSFRPAKST